MLEKRIIVTKSALATCQRNEIHIEVC